MIVMEEILIKKMNIEQLAEATNRTVRDLIERLQVDGYLREKSDTTNPANQTANLRHDGHFEEGANGPIFDDELSRAIIENYTLPKSNKPISYQGNSSHR